MPSILLTNFYNAKPLAFIRNLLPLGYELIHLEKPGQEEVIKKAPLADYFLVGGRTQIDHKVLEAASKLKMIQRSGVGLDSLDLDAIGKKKIPVFVNAGVNARSVAEHTLMLILGTLRKIALVDRRTRKGEWVKHDVGIDCHELFGKTVGLIGLGNIGTHVATMLNGFGVKIYYYKPHPLDEESERKLNVQFLPMEELLKKSDVLSLHCGFNAETQGLIGERELGLMKPGAVLINTARGGLVDETALMEALDKGQLAGAGLDVFAKEPLASEHPLFNFEKVLLTPHMGSITAESFETMIKSAIENVVLFDSGKSDQIRGKRIV